MCVCVCVDRAATMGSSGEPYERDGPGWVVLGGVAV